LRREGDAVLRLPAARDPARVVLAGRRGLLGQALVQYAIAP
jgi:hypothetical protein